MKARLLIAAMSTVLLVSCGTTPVVHPNCASLQQAERKNAKDLDAYCYTGQTQDSLKCEQAKDKRNHLRLYRSEMAQDTYIATGALSGISLPYETCPSQL